MAGGFNKSAQHSAAQAQDIFSKPLGEMLGDLGVLTAEQQDASGTVQAEMIAVRSKIEAGDITMEQAKTALGEFRGALDLGSLAKIPSENGVKQPLSDLGITGTDISAAKTIVDNAQETRSNVNEGHDLQVSPIGFIHTDLHAANIPNFGDIKQGALIAQRAIDAAQARTRIMHDTKDSDAGAKRGFKLWGDETPALKEIVTHAQALNERESTSGRLVEADIELLDTQKINGAFKAAHRNFQDAGQPLLAQKIASVQQNILPSLSPPPSNGMGGCDTSDPTYG
ncbi:MAG: hypothetical protein COB36_13745 [Alphaproteobacteria bacterium]|nr:MAG: hypothetical protein COB36_13745 [Alphaproteobacteria bacterium]